MNRLLALVSSGGREELLLQQGTGFQFSTQDGREVDPLLLALLRERDSRVGTGRATGEGVFDFRYGPFTGGLGETGILHLSTYGERILGVDVELSAKHRGIEARLEGMDPFEAAPIVQSVCGNFAFAHTHAFSLAVESALGIELDERTVRRCLIALELERIYNHLHVIGRLAEAAAQRVLAAHLAALFEEALRTNHAFSGSRYLWNTRRVGEMREDPSIDLALVRRRIGAIRERFADLYRASLSARNYLDRLHGIATVDGELAARRSLTGPSLRAAGTVDDLRTASPLLSGFSPVVREESDSLARMEVRAEEILASAEIVREQIDLLEGGNARRSGVVHRRGRRREGEPANGAPAGTRGIGAAEGPSGVVAWAVELHDDAIVSATASTPSLFGYQVFAEAFTGHIFTDFPFALDSFGLSFADAGR